MVTTYLIAIVAGMIVGIESHRWSAKSRLRGIAAKRSQSSSVKVAATGQPSAQTEATSAASKSTSSTSATIPYAPNNSSNRIQTWALPMTSGGVTVGATGPVSRNAPLAWGTSPNIAGEGEIP